MEVLVIVPTYNEIENLQRLIGAIFSELPEAHLLIVDDSSPDGTGQKAEELKKKESRLFVLHRKKKEGLGQAYLAGFRYALQQGYSYLIQMDADFSHPPEYLSLLLKPCKEENVSLVLGSRYVRQGKIVGWSLWRRGLSYFGSLYARFWLRVSVHDLTGGFKCWKREALTAISLEEIRSRGYCFQIELTYRAIRAGFKVLEIPITFPERLSGASKMSWRIAWEAAYRVPLMPFTIKVSKKGNNIK